MSSLLPMGDLEKRLKSMFGRSSAGSSNEELFRKLAGDISPEEMEQLSPDAKAAIMTERVQRSFNPLLNVFGNTPQGLAKRLAGRSVTGGAEALGSKDEIKEAADKFGEHSKEIIDRKADAKRKAEDLFERIDKATKQLDKERKATRQARRTSGPQEPGSWREQVQKENAQEAARRAEQARRVNETIAETTSMTDAERAIRMKENLKRLHDEVKARGGNPDMVGRAAEEMAKQQKAQREAGQHLLAKGTNEVMRAIKIRKSNQKRFEARRAEAEARGETYPEFERNGEGQRRPSLSDIMTEQVVPGIRFSKSAFERRHKDERPSR